MQTICSVLTLTAGYKPPLHASLIGRHNPVTSTVSSDLEDGLSVVPPSNMSHHQVKKNVYLHFSSTLEMRLFLRIYIAYTLFFFRTNQRVELLAILMVTANRNPSPIRQPKNLRTRLAKSLLFYLLILK